MSSILIYFPSGHTDCLIPSSVIVYIWKHYTNTTTSKVGHFTYFSLKMSFCKHNWTYFLKGRKHMLDLFWLKADAHLITYMLIHKKRLEKFERTQTQSEKGWPPSKPKYSLMTPLSMYSETTHLGCIDENNSTWQPNIHMHISEMEERNNISVELGVFKSTTAQSSIEPRA